MNGKDISNVLMSRLGRQLAIQDMVTIDVSDVVRQYGFESPVLISCGLWQDIHCVQKHQRQEWAQIRLTNVLFVGAAYLSYNRKNAREFYYKVVMEVGRRTNYTVRLVCTQGLDAQPVITLMRQCEY